MSSTLFLGSKCEDLGKLDQHGALSLNLSVCPCLVLRLGICMGVEFFGTLTQLLVMVFTLCMEVLNYLNWRRKIVRLACDLQ